MDFTNLTVIAYLIYLPVTIIMTFLVGGALFKNSKVFMLDIFRGREEIALPTNRLFKIGFYLLNIGTALMVLKMYQITTTQGMVETLTYKVGGFSIYLGLNMFFNLYLFFRGKKAAARKVNLENLGV